MDNRGWRYGSSALKLTLGKLSKSHKILTLITARSGSIRVKNKNSKSFAGKSLIEIAVYEALQAEHTDHIGFSSDSDDYIAIANQVGLSETYVRPQNLAQADTTSIDCAKDYLNWCANTNDTKFTHLMLLQPTSPFRTASMIDDSVESWVDSGKRSLISVADHDDGGNYLIKRDSATDKLSKLNTGNSDRYFTLDGAVFIAPLEMIYDENRFWDENSALHVTKYPRYFDIDTELDFSVAQALYRDKYRFEE